jgi:hypothetical protein
MGYRKSTRYKKYSKKRWKNHNNSGRNSKASAFIIFPALFLLLLLSARDSMLRIYQDVVRLARLIDYYKEFLIGACLIALLICVVYIARVVLFKNNVLVGGSGYLFYPLMGYQHRLIAARYLGRKLQGGEEVHHINGRKTDNDASNLAIMHRDQHRAFHRWLNYERDRLGGYPSLTDQRYALRVLFGATMLG